MKEPSFPPRLTDSTSDDFVRGILRAGRRDVAEPTQAQVSLAKYMDAREQGAIAEALRPAKSWLRLSTKLGSVALVGAIICFGWAMRHSTERAPRPLPTSEVAPSLAAPPLASVAPPSASEATLEPPCVRVDDLPSVAATEKPPARPTSVAPREPAAASTREAEDDTRGAPGSLRDELALVEAARASLTRSDAKECVRILDVYARRFGGGVLAHEVAAMRIEALVARGERERARALGEAFLASSPSSPYASRIRSILAATP
jgi:hypothetical protein